jgi:hypothetical protein
MLMFNPYYEVLWVGLGGTFKSYLDYEHSVLKRKSIHSWIHGLIDYLKDESVIKTSRGFAASCLL